MPKPPITAFSNLTVIPSVTNSFDGFYAPKLNQVQINAIPNSDLINGAIVYNTDTNAFNVYQNNAWVILNPASDVVGPAGAVADNIATFDGNTGKLIKDSGVAVGRVPGPIQKVGEPLFSGGGYIKFTGTATNDTGIIFLDSLSPVHFAENNYSGSNYQVSSVFTGGIPGTASTSVSALVELQTTTGALLLSRLTNTQVGALTAPTNGMLLYNTDTNTFQGYTNGSHWYDVFSNTAVGTNIGIGDGGLTSISDGAYNINIGYQGLQSTTIGNLNVNIGYQGLKANTSGEKNTSIGSYALTANTIASNNTAIGYQALTVNTTGTSNTAIGYQALFSNTTAYFNTAIGYQTLYSTTTGYSNTAIGYAAGVTNTTGSNCTFIGQAADTSVNNLTNACAIGYNSKVGVSNAVVLGNGCYVGIGKNSPGYALHLGTDNSSTPLIYMASTSYPSTPGTANDGIYSVSSGKPHFTSGTSIYTGTIVTTKNKNLATDNTAGSIFVNGTAGVIINTSAVGTDSIIIVSYSDGAFIPSFTNRGSLFVANVTAATSFKIYSTNTLDKNLVNWQIFNPDSFF